MKLWARVLTVFLCLDFFLMPAPVRALADHAGSVILMDAGSGRVLYEKNAHQPRSIASITKLMTALVALRSGHHISETVTVSPEWTGAEGSSLYLREGEQIRLNTLLYGLMLHSGNDAALAVAGYCGGSVEKFVARMNQTAVGLGMKNSHFTNPSGLSEDGHYSTAYDMALLARECIKDEILSEIVSTKSITLEGRTFQNHNKLLWQYDGCIGLKTGYTEKAGRTLVSAARRDGLTLICVTLSDANDWVDHKALLDHGFSNYKGVSSRKTGDVIGYLPVDGSLLVRCPLQVKEDTVFAVGAGEQIETQLYLEHQRLTAPVSRGIKVGELVYTLCGRELFRTDVVTCIPIPENAPREMTVWEKLREGCTRPIR